MKVIVPRTARSRDQDLAPGGAGVRDVLVVDDQSSELVDLEVGRAIRNLPEGRE